MGCSGTKLTPIKGLSRSEEFIVATERKLGLAKVPFSVFRQAVKKYGYKGLLQESHLREIAREINLDFEQLHVANSEVARVYKSERLLDTGGNYVVREFLHLGFLLCNHTSEKSQVKEAWNMMNPLLDDSISKDRLILFYEELAHIAVDMRLSIETAKDQAPEDVVKYLHRI